VCNTLEVVLHSIEAGRLHLELILRHNAGAEGAAQNQLAWVDKGGVACEDKPVPGGSECP
jgi:hypothetical protein